MTETTTAELWHWMPGNYARHPVAITACGADPTTELTTSDSQAIFDGFEALDGSCPECADILRGIWHRYEAASVEKSDRARRR